MIPVSHMPKIRGLLKEMDELTAALKKVQPPTINDMDALSLERRQALEEALRQSVIKWFDKEIDHLKDKLRELGVDPYA